jgi:uncharacterized protein (DUF433 family)
MSDLKDYLNIQMQDEEFKREYENLTIEELLEVININNLTVSNIASSLKRLSFTKNKALYLASRFDINKEEVSACLKLYDKAKELLDKYNDCNINDMSIITGYYKAEWLLYLEFKTLQNKLKK